MAFTDQVAIKILEGRILIVTSKRKRLESLLKSAFQTQEIASFHNQEGSQFEETTKEVVENLMKELTELNLDIKFLQEKLAAAKLANKL